MATNSKSQWVLPEERPPEEWDRLCRKWGVPTPVLTTLWNRGVRTDDGVERFLRPQVDDLHDPFLLTDMDVAVERLEKAAQGDESVVVFGDYDVDGITSTSLFARVLGRRGLSVECMLPNRLEDGYGLNVGAVERTHAAGSRLIIVADCGTTAHEPIERARELGVDVIVCDHHMPEAKLPPATALINPRRSGDRYPFADLAAVGVCFKFLQGWLERHGTEEDRRFLFNQLDLVALGTVADVVPLRDENRVFAHYGIRVLRVRRRPAFQALIDEARLTDKLLDSSHIAFSLAPRLNAAGRLGDPTCAFELLTSDDLAAARTLARQLEEVNNERKGLNERVQQESIDALAELPEPPGSNAVVLGSAEWHPGVLGIAASRLVGQYGVPVLLVSLQGEVARGSARAPEGVNLLPILEQGAEHLLGFGGHRRAAGFSMVPDAFPAFQEAVVSRSRSLVDGLYDPRLDLDGVLEPGECDIELARWLERLGPFGEGNAEPLFTGRALCRGARVLAERHLKLQAWTGGNRIDCIGFGLGEFAGSVPSRGVNLQLAFTPTVNRYRGQERVQLKLREIDFV